MTNRLYKKAKERANNTPGLELLSGDIRFLVVNEGSAPAAGVPYVPDLNVDEFVSAIDPSASIDPTWYTGVNVSGAPALAGRTLDGSQFSASTSSISPPAGVAGDSIVLFKFVTDATDSPVIMRIADTLGPTLPFEGDSNPHNVVWPTPLAETMQNT